MIVPRNCSKYGKTNNTEFNGKHKDPEDVNVTLMNDVGDLSVHRVYEVSLLYLKRNNALSQFNGSTP